MTENNGLPQGWVKVNLEECVDILDSQRIPINATERIERISGKTEESLFPYFGATGRVGWIDDFIFDEELVLLGEDGAPFLEGFKQKAYIIRGKTWVNNHAHVLRAINGVALNSYLKHYLDVIDYHEFVTGTTRLKLNQSQMRKIPVKLPPFPEQERIVARIEELFTQLDAGVAELRNAKAQLKRYRGAVLKAAVEGELTREWREAHQGEIEPAEKLLARILSVRREKLEAEGGNGKYKEPAAPNTDNLPALPDGWVWVRFEQLIVEGPQNGLYLPKTAYGSGFPILRIDDYQNNSSRSSNELRMVTLPEDLLEKYKLSLDDLVINRVNSPSHLGKCLKVADRNLPAIFESNMMRLHLSIYVDVSFVEKYLHSHIGKEQLIKNAKWAVNQASINQQDVKNTIVPLPPLEEQNVIAAKIERRLSVADEIEKELDGALVRAERLRGSVLKSAFEGRLV